jgi:4-amino-4-deoxy-L-arabinose transferase-like glycosyltransferase
MSPSSKTPRNITRWLLVALVLVAFGRGIWALGGKSLWWDESLSLYRAQEDFAFLLSTKIILTDTLNQVVTIDKHPPLYFILLWLVVRLFGQSEFALRFLSLAPVVLMVPLLFATGRRLVDKRVGLGAAALGAISPMYLWYGQEMRMYALLAFLSLVSFYFFVRAFCIPQHTLSLRRQWPWIAAYVLASTCIAFTHYLGILVIAFELLVLGLLSLRRTGTRRVLLSIIVMLLLVSLLPIAYALLTLSESPIMAGPRFVPLLYLLRDVLNSFSLGLSVDIADWYVVAVDLGFLVLLILGIGRLVRPRATTNLRRSGWLLVGYLFIPLLLLYLLSFVQPAYLTSRHLILATPAFYLLVAVGLTSWRGRGARTMLLGWLLVTGGMVYSTYNYFYDPTYEKDDHREWGAYLREHVRPGDVVVVDPPHIEELYSYYASSDAPWIGLPLLDRPQKETVEQLRDLLNRYDRVWLAFSSTPRWGDRRRFPEKWLNENAFRVDYREFQGYGSAVLVACYLRTWPSVARLPDGAQPVEARYSPSLRLVGYRPVSPAQPDRLLHVELYWAVDQLGPEEASVVLRLVDDQGHVWGEGEQCPFNGLYPMWQWQPGLTLRDEHELALQPGTPPGTYQLEVMLRSRPAEEGCLGAPGGPIRPIAASPQISRGDSVWLGEIDVGVAGVPASLDELDIQRRRRVRFGGLVLRGEHLVPDQLKPGERLHASLYWEAREASLPDWVFRLRLLDDSGRIWQEALLRPAGEAYPTDRWLESDRYKGQFWLRLPEDAPPGRYRLEMEPEAPPGSMPRQAGLWATLRRWLGAGQDTVRLGAVEVQALPPRPSALPAADVPLPDSLDVSHPMLATLGGQIRFLGYDMEADTVRAGGEVRFNLYWQALGPTEVSFSVFTHLLGPSNQILGQKDGPPLDGNYPTTRWQQGEVIADPYAFTVDPSAPPGEYPLEVGFYRLETGVRLPVVDAEGLLMPHDRILLLPIKVLPALTPTPVPPIEWRRVYLPVVGAGP